MQRLVDDKQDYHDQCWHRRAESVSTDISQLACIFSLISFEINTNAKIPALLKFSISVSKPACSFRFRIDRATIDHTKWTKAGQISVRAGDETDLAWSEANSTIFILSACAQSSWFLCVWTIAQTIDILQLRSYQESSWWESGRVKHSSTFIKFDWMALICESFPYSVSHSFRKQMLGSFRILWGVPET